MKTIFALMLLLSAALCADVSRTSTFTIDSNFTADFSMKELYVGEWAKSAATSVYLDGFDYVQSRAALADITTWSVAFDNDTLELIIDGDYPMFVRKTAEQVYSIGGIGFTDSLCDRPEGTLKAITQEMNTRVIIPEGTYVAAVPKNYSGEMDYIQFRLTNRVSGNELQQTLRMTVKSNVYAADYCNDREEVEQWFSKPFIVTTNAKLIEKYAQLNTTEPIYAEETQLIDALAWICLLSLIMLAIYKVTG